MVAHKIKVGRRADCSRKLVEAGDVLINFLLFMNYISCIAKCMRYEHFLN